MIHFFLILTFLFPFLTWAQEVAPVIQRYGIVGTDTTGKRLAVMLTYFGPSSGSPIAHLLVLEVGKEDPLLHDGMFMMSGGEIELAQIASEILEKNKMALEALGIDMSSPIYGDANYFLESTIPPIAGALDIENVGILNFQIDSETSDQCKYPNTQIIIKMGTHGLAKTPNDPNDCRPGSLQLRHIIRTKTAAWFFILKKEDSLGTPFIEVKVLGLAF